MQPCSIQKVYILCKVDKKNPFFLEYGELEHTIEKNWRSSPQWIQAFTREWWSMHFPKWISRSSDGLPQMESRRSCHAPGTLDSLRQRPLIGFTGAAYDDPRGVSYMSRGLLGHSRPTAFTSYLAKLAQAARPAKMIGSSPALRPPACLAQKSAYVIDDQPTVDSFLHSLELDKYAILFKAKEVDMHALRQMGDADLKELGVPMGPRKKIMQSLVSRGKRPM